MDPVCDWLRPLTWLAAMLLTASPAYAETIRQSVDVIGWTNTGSELVTAVTLEASGIDEDGDPVDWSYSLLEVRNARTGKLLNSYTMGDPPSTPQKGWDSAKPSSDGKTFLEKVGMVQALRGQVDPSGARILVDGLDYETAPMTQISDVCPGCDECVTTLSMTLIDPDARMAWRLPSQTRTGSPFPPADAMRDCPTLTLRAFWHPNEDRLALVVSEEFRSTGALIESVRGYQLEKDQAGWTSVALSKPKRERQLEAVRAQSALLKEELAGTEDPGVKSRILRELGDQARANGDPAAAAGYYDTALEYDARNLRALLGRAHLLADSGNTGKARRLAARVERADRRTGALHAEIGIFRIAVGDLDSARASLQAAVDAGQGASVDQRLRLGVRILRADLAAGLAYMRNLYNGIDDDTEVDRQLLAEATVEVTDASIHLRDLTAAAEYLTHLDPKGPEARRLALMIGALRNSDPVAMDPILDAVDALLNESPGACELYYVKGMAYLRLTRAEDAYVHLAAAVACDPTLEEAHYYLADMYRFAGRLPESRRHYRSYLDLAPAQRGDEARTLRRSIAQTMAPRMEHTGAVLLRWDCDDRERFTCRGVVFNSSPAPTGPVSVSLTATALKRRKQVVVTQSDAVIPQIAPGQSVNFAIQLPLQAAAVQVDLEVGRSEVEKRVNRTRVNY